MLSRYAIAEGVSLSAGAFSNQFNGFVPFILDNSLTMTQLKMLLSVSMNTSTSGTRSGYLSVALGVYSLTGSTLTSMASGSVSYSWSFTSNVSTASYNGVKEFSVAAALSMTPGQYWIGYLLQTSNGGTANGSCNLSMMGGVQNYSGSFGESSGITSRRIDDGLGYYATSTAAMRASVNLTDINYMNPRTPWVLMRATGVP